MGVFGNGQVLFKVAPAAAKPGPPAKDEYYILSEGQRQDDIEVLKIDDKKSLVTFDNHGFTQELPLANTPASGGSGGPAAAASPGGMNPGMAPRPPGGGMTLPRRFHPVWRRTRRKQWRYGKQQPRFRWRRPKCRKRRRHEFW